MTLTLEAAREWGISILRWPGGDFASGYHWQDGIGPKSSRPRRYNAAWFEEESNQFGTDEFVAYCRKLNAEPYICVNLGTGTAEEAANWVEYCNGTGNTSYANLRRRNGFTTPHKVRFWGLGNEIYGEWQIGHKSAEDYAKVALECAKLMKRTDPGISLVACGSDNPQWNQTVLQKLGSIVDYVSVHDYEGSEDYYDLLGSVQRLEQRLREMDAAIELTQRAGGGPDPILALSLPELKSKRRVQIACDEWNIWYRKMDIWKRDVLNPVEERCNLRDALWVASVRNLFHRMADKIAVANLAQMVNVIAPIFTSPEGVLLQATYFPLKLYRQQCGTYALGSEVNCPTFSSITHKAVSVIDTSATIDAPGRAISLAVVNRHKSKPVRGTVDIRNADISNKAALFEINGRAPEVENSFAARCLFR